jgi:phage tail-like protein
MPSIEWETKEVKEGGLNTYVHQLPVRRKPSKVTLKRGLIRDAFLDWYTEIMNEDFTNARKTVDITLFDSQHNAVLKWTCQKAYPIKWSGPDLKAGDNAVATETLELACAAVTFEVQQD